VIGRDAFAQENHGQQRGEHGHSCTKIPPRTAPTAATPWFQAIVASTDGNSAT
jgi:hypothetical protein